MLQHYCMFSKYIHIKVKSTLNIFFFRWIWPKQTHTLLPADRYPCFPNNLIYLISFTWTTLHCAENWHQHLKLNLNSLKLAIGSNNCRAVYVRFFQSSPVLAMSEYLSYNGHTNILRGNIILHSLVLQTLSSVLSSHFKGKSINPFGWIGWSHQTERKPAGRKFTDWREWNWDHT